MIVHGIAGHDRPAEAGFVDGHEIDQRRLLEGFEVAHAQRARRLRHALDQQYARHDRAAGKMTLKLRFVGGDVLDADAEFVSLRADDPIDQQEGIAMRQKTQQSLNIVAFQGLACRHMHSLAPDL